MEVNAVNPKSIVRLLQKRSLDGLNFNSNPGLRFYKDTISSSQSLYQRDLLGHYGCVNAIEFSSNGDLIASGGDDRRLLLWNVWQTIFDSQAPLSIDTQHLSNINSCSFDIETKTVATGGSDGQVIIHDVNTMKTTSSYRLNETVFCLSPDPINATNIAIASDDGKVQILDTRLPLDSGLVVIADLGASMHSVMFNPSEPRLLATADSKHGISLWDVRKPRNVFIKSGIQNCMSVRFNSRGDQLLTLRRRGCPVLYDMKSLEPICKFDYKTYYNACTLKSASFAGLQEEFVMSGSDDFCIYLWRIPDASVGYDYVNSEPHMILKGHRSIVNQVRYCPYNQMILSSGVEKLIKMWTPYALPGSTGHLRHSRRYGDDDEMERNAYSHEEYIHMVLRAGSFLSHDYSNGNTDEEPCMIAFFDSLIQREVEQSAEDSDNTTDTDKEHDRGNSQLLSGSDNEGSEHSHPRRRGDRVRIRLSQADDESSSDSASEVDEILSAMYNRYMHSRDQEISDSGPTGRKISSVIAQRKHRDRIRDRTSKRHSASKRGDHPSRLESHSNGDFYHEDNTRTMSVLADVLDNFVDNLVGSDGSTGSNQSLLSDITDGGIRINSPSSVFVNPSSPVHMSDNSPPRRDQVTNSSAVSSQSSPFFSRSSSARNRSHLCNDNRERDLYFAPELEAFSPRLSSSSSESDTPINNLRDFRVRRRKDSPQLRLLHGNEPGSTRDASSSDTDNNSSESVSNKRKKCMASRPTVDLSQTSSRSALATNLPIKDNIKVAGSSSKSKNTVGNSASKCSSSQSAPPKPPMSSSGSPHLHLNATRSSVQSSSAINLVSVTEKKPIYQMNDDELIGDIPGEGNQHVAFKKLKKSKGRKFRKSKRHDSSSSSDNEDR